MSTISMPSGIIRGRVTSCCFLGRRIGSARGLCGAASGWVGFCAIIIKKRHDAVSASSVFCPYEETRGVIQPDRIDEMRAGRAPRREELLKVAQRDPCFRRDLARTERRFGKAVPHDAANAGEKLVRMKGARHGI